MLNSQIEAPEEQPRDEATNPARDRKFYWWIGWGAFWIVVLYAVFCVVENIRGRAAWRAYVGTVTARGESLTVEPADPAAVPEELNFAMSPLLRDAFTTLPADLTSLQVRTGKLNAKGGIYPPQWPAVSRRERFDLAEWSEFFRRRAFISQVDSETSHKAVLRVLDEFDPDVRELIAEERAKPLWQPPIGPENELDPLGYSRRFSGLVEVLALRSTALLRDGQVPAAHAGVCLGLRLAAEADEIQDRAILLVLIRPPLWEGIWDHRWSDDQLREFEERLARINHAAKARDYIIRQRDQRVFAQIDWWRQSLSNAWDPNRGGFIKQRWHIKRITDAWLPGATWPQDVAIGVSTLMPDGWYDQNKAAVGYAYDALQVAVKPAERRLDVKRADATSVEASKLEKSLPAPYTHIFGSGFYDSMGWLIRRAAEAQKDVELTRIAIALERHRIRHGTYPARLEEIDPRALPSEGLPSSPIVGERVVFELTGDDSFRLDLEPIPRPPRSPGIARPLVPSADAAVPVTQ